MNFPKNRIVTGISVTDKRDLITDILHFMISISVRDGDLPETYGYSKLYASS